MPDAINFWPLLGVAVVVVGFALRRNPVLVVVAAGIASALGAGISIPDLLTLLGQTFVENRVLMLFLLTLPVIGLLEHYGLRERARTWIVGFRGLNLTRFQVTYLGLRQLLSMVGLNHVAGHPQTVRPLVAPMSEAAAERTLGSELTDTERATVRASAAATDNVGLFFGEDVFMAFGAVLLIQGFYARNGIFLEPLAISLWALPTAIAAFIIHSIRIRLLQRRLERERAKAEGTNNAAS
ncbi:MAG TPA: DUF969 domain-containing protein [Dokdonella sp.]|uniref:DUF969 domain-containing protein n=1 Tax=Dokdonella sp. TaxID=2291710 RepID=UPI002D80E1FB|nr:DUF969 domain-containing protein [Dokdonella sp.]HET9032356.1 DUF969 domain-containing protein [Dokdonella sp.]